MVDTELTRSDRVNIDESVMDIYNSLRAETIKDKGGMSILEDTPFNTNKDIFMFALCFGFNNKTRRKLPPGKKYTIRKEVFSDNDIYILKAIALAEAGDGKVLGNFGEIITIAEEYAFGGIMQVKGTLLDQSGRPLWNLVEILLNTT